MEIDRNAIVVSLVSQKGGVGKSSLSRAFAREAAQNDLQVKIADLDIQQATSLNWVRRRLDADITPAISAQPFKTALQAIEGAVNHDLLIIDGPARASAGTLEIAKNSDVVVQPTGASVDDLEPAVLLFNELIKNGIPRDKLYFALSRVGTESEERAAREYIAQAGLRVLDGCIYEKPAYRQAQNQGYAMTEVKYQKLQKGADSLIQSLINKLPQNV